MKKTICIILVLVLACSTLLIFAACNKEEEKKDDTFEIALVTDVGTIDDKSFNQGSWEGVVKYATENNITHKYYKPAGENEKDYVDAIGLAVASGAKVVVCPGFLFEVPLYTAQTMYPDTKFILIDGAPHNEDYSDFKTGDNVASIFFAEEQAAFLAGYAAVKDGMTGLGFMGGMAVPAVVRFGYGFIQGAEVAAQELGLAEQSVTIKYNYTGKFAATPEAETQAAGWFAAGTEVIFGCGGALGNSVMAAAEKASKKAIGVDVDQSAESATVITSAMKMLQKAVYDNLADFYAGTFKGGESQVLDAKVGGVGLPMETSKFDTFTAADYDAVFAKVVAGDFQILKDTDAGVDGDPTAGDKPLATTYVKIEYVK